MDAAVVEDTVVVAVAVASGNGAVAEQVAQIVKDCWVVCPSSRPRIFAVLSV
jgi:hypothetical protein